MKLAILSFLISLTFYNPSKVSAQNKNQGPSPIESLSFSVEGCGYNAFSWVSAQDCDDCIYTIDIKCAEGCEGGNFDYQYTETTDQLSILLHLEEKERQIAYKKYKVTLTSKRNGKVKEISKIFELKCKQ